MFTTRGQPVVYYGDEQGFAGAGGDKDARQDMFATKVAQYATEANVLGVERQGPLRHQLGPLPAGRGAVGAAQCEPGARRRCPGAPLRVGPGGHLRLLPDRQGDRHRVRRRAEHRSHHGGRQLLDLPAQRWVHAALRLHVDAALGQGRSRDRVRAGSRAVGLEVP